MALLWELYVQKLAKTSVKDYVLSVIHERMLAAECRLSWSTFYPRREHLHSMVTLVDTFLPMCHEFLGKGTYQYSIIHSSSNFILCTPDRDVINPAITLTLSMYVIITARH